MKSGAMVSVLLVCLFLSRGADAEIRRFHLEWSGAAVPDSLRAYRAFREDLMATGEIAIDDSVFKNPGRNVWPRDPFVVDFSMTVSGADCCNGTFQLSDFSGIGLNTTSISGRNGVTLDLSRELVGQPGPGDEPWGIGWGPADGEFNVFSPDGDGVPSGLVTFTVLVGRNQGGLGNPMFLTSFRPIPEPSSIVLAAIGIGGVGLFRRRRS